MIGPQTRWPQLAIAHANELGWIVVISAIYGAIEGGSPECRLQHEVGGVEHIQRSDGDENAKRMERKRCLSAQCILHNWLVIFSGNFRRPLHKPSCLMPPIAICYTYDFALLKFLMVYRMDFCKWFADSLRYRRSRRVCSPYSRKTHQLRAIVKATLEWYDLGIDHQRFLR